MSLKERTALGGDGDGDGDGDDDDGDGGGGGDGDGDGDDGDEKSGAKIVVKMEICLLERCICGPN